MKNSGSRSTTRDLSGVTAAGVRSNILPLPCIYLRKRGARRIRLLITRGPGSLNAPARAATAAEALPRPTATAGPWGVHHGPFGLLVLVFQAAQAGRRGLGWQATAVRSFASARRYSGSLTHCEPRGVLPG